MLLSRPPAPLDLARLQELQADLVLVLLDRGQKIPVNRGLLCLLSPLLASLLGPLLPCVTPFLLFLPSCSSPYILESLLELATTGATGELTQEQVKEMLDLAEILGMNLTGLDKESKTNGDIISDDNFQHPEYGDNENVKLSMNLSEQSKKPSVEIEPAESETVRATQPKEQNMEEIIEIIDVISLLHSFEPKPDELETKTEPSIQYFLTDYSSVLQIVKEDKQLRKILPKTESTHQGSVSPNYNEPKFYKPLSEQEEYEYRQLKKKTRRLRTSHEQEALLFLREKRKRLQGRERSKRSYKNLSQQKRDRKKELSRKYNARMRASLSAEELEAYRKRQGEQKKLSRQRQKNDHVENVK